MQIPILVINLDRSTDRLGDIARKMDGMGLSFERIVAVDGSNLTEEQKRGVYRKRFWRRELTAGEIGCYLSHLKAMRYMLEKQMESAIILEDDADFDDYFAALALGQFKLDFSVDVLKLQGTRLNNQTYIKPPLIRHPNVVAITNTHGAVAYLVTRQGAQKALRRLRHIRYAYDDDLFCNWRNALKIYDLFPYPVRYTRTPTTIPNRDSAKPTKLEKHAMRIARIIPKNYDKLRKHVFQLRRFGFASLNQTRLDEFMTS